MSAHLDQPEGANKAPDVSPQVFRRLAHQWFTRARPPEPTTATAPNGCATQLLHWPTRLCARPRGRRPERWAP